MSTEKPTGPIGKLLEIVREFGKMIGFKINVYKLIAFLHTCKN